MKYFRYFTIGIFLIVCFCFSQEKIIIPAGKSYTLQKIKKEIDNTSLFEYAEKNKVALCKEDLIIEGKLLLNSGDVLKISPGKKIILKKDSEFISSGSKENPVIITGTEGNFFFIGEPGVKRFEMVNTNFSNCGKGPLVKGFPKSQNGLYLIKAKKIRIENCKFSNNFIGIIIFDSQEIKINKNYFTKNKNYCIALSGTDKAEVKENELYENGGGIYLISGNKNSYIWKNNLESSGGILLLINNSNCIIEQNTILFCKRWAIRLDHSNNNIIKNNIVNFCNNVGIYLCGGSSQNIFTENTIKNCYRGIYINGASGNKFVRNTISGSKAGYDVFIGGSSHNIFIDTQFKGLKKMDEKSTLELKKGEKK